MDLNLEGPIHQRFLAGLHVRTRGYKTHNIDVILKNSTSIHFTLEFVLIKFGQTVWGCQADHYYVIGSTDFFERDIIFNHQAKFILPTNSFQFVINK